MFALLNGRMVESYVSVDRYLVEIDKKRSQSHNTPKYFVDRKTKLFGDQQLGNSFCAKKLIYKYVTTWFSYWSRSLHSALLRI